jgi:hypothetical protein
MIDNSLSRWNLLTDVRLRIVCSVVCQQLSGAAAALSEQARGLAQAEEDLAGLVASITPSNAFAPMQMK